MTDQPPRSAFARVAPPEPMTESEILTRAREAFIAARKPPRWLAASIRRGWADKLVAPVVTALRDINRPLALIIAERDEVTAAIILNTTPVLAAMPEDEREVVTEALLTAVRMGRRG